MLLCGVMLMGACTPDKQGKTEEELEEAFVKFQEREITLNMDDEVTLVPVFTGCNPQANELEWSSSDEAVASVTQSGLVKAKHIGKATIEVTHAKLDISAKCYVEVTYDLNGHEYVDLGLPSGNLWATMNIGASSPEDYGDYFAWGETETKSNYSKSTYKYSSKVDMLALQNDAAHMNWGGIWRMPTIAEFSELLNTCTWTWSSKGGHDGYFVTGTNGNSIFLPAAGYYDGSSLEEKGSVRYWSSTYEGVNSYGNIFGYALYGKNTYYLCGWYGASVRPVCSPQ